MSDMMRLQAAVEIEAATDTKPRRLSIVAYNGDLMNVEGFGPVVIDLAGMERPISIPILSDHENKLASIVASGAPNVTGSTLSVKATLADSDAARNVVALLASGVSLQASVGCSPTARRYIAANEKILANGKSITAPAGGITFIEKSVLREISITPVGADSSTSVSLAAKSPLGASPMPETLPIDRDTILREERERRSSIDTICAGLHLDTAASAQLDTIRAKAISGEIGLDALRASALDLLRASRPKVSVGFAGSEGRVNTPAHLTAALMVRAGYSTDAEKEYGANVMEQSQHLHSASLVDLCRAALMIDGRNAPHGRDAMLRASLSTGSLPIALGDSAHKILTIAYRMAPAAWRSFAASKPATDFKVNHAIRPTFAGDLAEVGDGGEVTHARIGEEVYTWQVGQFAKQVQIGRKAIINDDASVFSEVIPALARSAVRTLNGLVAKTVLANAGSFWSTANANYQEGAGTALSASSLAAAITLLRKMKDNDGNLLDLLPVTLLTPPELEQTAKALVASATLQRYVAVSADNQPMGNPLENVAQVVVEPRLSDTGFTGHSATGWYLFSAPENASVVCGFLDGQQMPTIQNFDMNTDIDHLSFGFRIFHDFGCALGDFRASIRSKGAA